MTKFFAVLAGVSALALSTAAFAGGPIQLTDRQMDMVTAGGPATAIVSLNAFAFGGTVTGAQTTGTTSTKSTPGISLSAATGDSGSLSDDTTAIGSSTGFAGGTAVSGTQIAINTSAVGNNAAATGSVISAAGSYPLTGPSISSASLTLGSASP